jgi:hypothetical protein
LLKYPVRPGAAQAVSGAVLGLLPISLEAEGREVTVPKANVGDLGDRPINQEQGMLEIGAGFSAVEDTGRKQRYGVAKLPKEPGEQAVQLETVTATTADDDFLKQVAGLQGDGPTQRNVEVFKRYGPQVRQVEGTERSGCRVARAADANAGEVSIDLHQHPGSVADRRPTTPHKLQAEARSHKRTSRRSVI